MSSDTTRAGGRDGDGGGGAAHALPHGASHWDRIPRELHDGILDAAGPLTRLTASDLHPAEVRCMSRQDRERLWADVVELDWQGDLASLPRDIGTDQTLSLEQLCASSRGMLAFRNGWTDLLVQNDALVQALIAEGELDKLKSPLKSNSAIRVWDGMCLHAIRQGQLNIAKFLYSKLDDNAFTDDWMADTGGIALESSKPECVEWLESKLNKSFDFPDDALEKACWRGHARIVDYLLKVRHIGSVHDAIVFSARNGQTGILELLFQKYPGEAKLTRNVVSPDFETLKWLHARGADIDTRVSLVQAMRSGSANSVKWLCGTFNLQIPEYTLRMAYESGDTALLKFLLGRPEFMIAQAVPIVAHYSFDALKVLLDHDPEWIRAAYLGCKNPWVRARMRMRYPDCTDQSPAVAKVVTEPKLEPQAPAKVLTTKLRWFKWWEKQ
nr:hypothetical protein HK105_002734 [Polyrhizophydium stewartii]